MRRALILLVAVLALLAAPFALAPASADGPAITSISPSSGPANGGTLVAIDGSGLSGATSVRFGSITADPVYVSDAVVYAYAPGGSAGATVDVDVTSPAGTATLVGAYKYTAAAVPAVTSLSPATAAGGATIIIQGSGFLGASAVYFGDRAATSFSFLTDSVGTATAPAGVGTVTVTVTGPGGTSSASSAAAFTYTTAAPTVAEIAPTSGSLVGGTPVIVTGTGFADGTGTLVTSVTVGGAAATWSMIDDTHLSVTTPASATADTVDIVVTTAAGSSSEGASDRFSYTVPPAPTITGISPSSGAVPGREPVTITGTNLAGATAVSFGATTALPPLTVNPDGTSLTVTAPAACTPATVAVTVTTPGGISTQSVSFTYTAATAAPTITGLSPATGPTAGHTAVTVTGTGLECAQLSFGGTPAPIFIPNSDGTSATAYSPAGSAGAVDVVASRTGTTSATTPSDRFVYTDAPPVGTAPAITSAAPPSGTVGSAYAFTVVATGDPAPTFSTGAGLPPGLSLASSGALTGTPTTPGDYRFTVTASNGTSPDAEAVYTLAIVAAAAAPTITSSAPPEGTVGSVYAFTVVATGDPAPTFSATGLPPGLTLDPDGVIAGTPTTAGTFSVGVTATNGVAPDATSSYRIVIAPTAAGTPVSTPPARTLASTGVDAAPTAALAAALAMLGALLISRGARRRPRSRPTR